MRRPCWNRCPSASWPAVRRACVPTPIPWPRGSWGGSALDDLLARRPARIETDGRHIACGWAPLESGGYVGTLRDETDAVEAAGKEALSDDLTGLPNRAAYQEELTRTLSQVERGGGHAVALLIDLDKFKPVNDTFGRAIGDRVLATVAKRLRHLLRRHDAAARLGGDAFAIALSELGSDEGAAMRAAESIARRIVDLLGRTFVVDGQMITLGCSVGIALSQPGDDAPELLRRADLALDRVKEGGRGGHAFFAPAMDEAMRDRREREAELRRAIALEEFVLYYQPQFDLSRNVIVGWEALIRWDHPERGLLGPGEFIALAEETGLIVPLGEWVVRTACRAATNWPEEMGVSVNVSPVQFASDKLLPTIEGALAVSGLANRRLEVEITETVLMSDSADTIAMLNRLHEIGVRVALDDFGTGYSSIGYLRRFAFDVIKIDQSFVRSTENTAQNGAIVRAIAQLARHLGAATTAEGVETKAQLEAIRADGCTLTQGYFIGRPVPESEIPAIIAAVEASRGKHALEMMEDLEEIIGEHAATVDEEPAEQAEADLHRLVYRSRSAIIDIEADIRTEVEQILETARARNAEVGVTGALLFNGTSFVQVLEGTREAVEETFERIQLDPRHADVVLLDMKPVEARNFRTWSMAHVSDAADAMTDLAERSGFDRDAVRADAITERLHELLLSSA